MFTSLVIFVREIVLALPPENLTAFAIQRTRYTRCSNLLDVLEPNHEKVQLSAGHYLRQFRGWREAADGDDDGDE